jgi:hypothetical protein
MCCSSFVPLCDDKSFVIERARNVNMIIPFTYEKEMRKYCQSFSSN